MWWMERIKKKKCYLKCTIYKKKWTEFNAFTFRSFEIELKLMIKTCDFEEESEA